MISKQAKKNLKILEHGFLPKYIHLVDSRVIFENIKGSGRYGHFSNLCFPKFIVVAIFSNLLDEWVCPTNKGD